MVLQRNFPRKSAIQPKATSKSELKSVADLSASFCHLESGSGSYLNPNPYKKTQKLKILVKTFIKLAVMFKYSFLYRTMIGSESGKIRGRTDPNPRHCSK